MSILSDLFGKKPYSSEHKDEVEHLITELIKIGKTDDFLSERPGSPFNAHCRHIRARKIGQRLDEIGGFPLMDYAYHRVRKKTNVELAAHLEYAWAEIGTWLK